MFHCFKTIQYKKDDSMKIWRKKLICPHQRKNNLYATVGKKYTRTKQNNYARLLYQLNTNICMFFFVDKCTKQEEKEKEQFDFKYFWSQRACDFLYNLSFVYPSVFFPFYIRIFSNNNDPIHFRKKIRLHNKQYERYIFYFISDDWEFMQKIKNHQTYVMCKEEEKKYVCMSAWVWESARDRTKEKNKKKKKKIWKTYEKKNNKKKIINHLKTSFYCGTSNDFIEKKERKKSKQNGVFHFLYTCFYRILAFVFIGHHLFVPGGRDPVLI